MEEISDRVKALLDSQLKEWDLAAVNYRLLANVRTREIDFGDLKLLVQFNPELIRSSAAKVDTKSIEERPCFLCEKNRPPEQKGVAFSDDMVILVNPFPIFTKHLTIPSEEHILQRIKKNFGNMLDLAQALPDFVIFYNGPECGASAPDHLHFQAGNRGFLPIEKDFEDKRLLTRVKSDSHFEMWQWEHYLRGIISFQGSNVEMIMKSFKEIYEGLSEIQQGKPEPMLNILVYFADGNWIIHIIPRKLHRPSQYFAEEEKKILLSPASVDLGGVLIVPREEDFEKITAEDISDIFRQVCLDDSEIKKLTSYA
jgi:ATP adenylyltransferase/5',5'''-P-1,P-4-tetraphosphate phosphorylase II